MNKQATVMSLANQKGGVGKTSTTVMISMELAKEGYKVLDIDVDSQTNLTDTMLKTKYPNKDDISVGKTLMNCIDEEAPLKEAVVNIKHNIDLIPSAFDVFNYEDYLADNYSDKTKRTRDLSNRVDQLRDDYDFIFIDTPPSISFMSNAAFLACDEILLIMQTQKRSFEGVQKFVDYIQDILIDTFDAPTSVLGILPVLRKKHSPIDDSIIQAAKDLYGKEYIFNNVIYNMRRVERMDFTGITDDNKDHWDVVTHNAYKRVADELVDKLKEV